MRNSILLAIFLFPLCSIAQMEVDNTLLIEDLVLDSLVGENITISNVLYNGAAANTSYTNVGAFNASNSNIPILSGIVIATGNAEEVIGPNNSGNSSIDGDAPEYTDIDIDSIITGNNGAHDLSVLEFDFIPEGNFISMTFVFSSEEYNEYVCAQFNDAFGIFLSGPGIDGPYENAGVNVVLVPDTEIPVSINTVNLGIPGSDGDSANCSLEGLANSAYFIDNSINSDTTSTQMDGFTIPILVSSSVQAGESYHLKIAIADAADDNFDSAVFLKSNSFKASTYDPLSIYENENESVFHVYPNPASDYLIIENPDGNPIDKVTIYSLVGKKVLEETNQSKLDLSHFEAGTYIIEILSEGNSFAQKVIVQ